MLNVVGLLEAAPPVGLGDGPPHRVREPIGVHDHLSVDVPGGAADGLDERGLAPEEPLLVGVEDGDERDLGQVQPFAEQVDADQHVELAEAQVAEDLDSLDGVDVGMQVAHPDALFEQVVGEFLGHLLGEGRDEHALVGGHPFGDERLEVIDLAPGGLHEHLGVDEARGPDDLLNHAAAVVEFPRARGGRQEHHLAHPVAEFLEPQRPVVGRRGQAEAVLDQGCLAAAITVVLAVQLRDSHVRLVDDHEEVVREVVEQGVGPLPGGPPVDVGAVVLDAVAEPQLADHLEVVLGAHPKSLGLQQFLLALEVGEALLEFLLDRRHRPGEDHLVGGVVGGREDHQFREFAQVLAGQGVDLGDRLDLITEQRDPDGGLLVGGMDLKRVAPDPELSPPQHQVIALVLHVNQAPQRLPLVDLLALSEDQQVALVELRVAEPVDTRHRGHDDGVAPGEECCRGGMTQPVDLVVHGRVLLDEGVTRGQVRLGLVVVVVGDEVFDPVLRKERPELVGQLRCKGLVGGDNQGRALDLLDHPGEGGALATARDAEQGLEALAVLDASGQLVDGAGLIACRQEGRLDVEPLTHGRSVATPPDRFGGAAEC